ncbi:MAG: mannosyltransferase family protein [Streptosporangiaceae bacterium]
MTRLAREEVRPRSVRSAVGARFARTDRWALGAWLLTRVGLVFLTLASGVVLAGQSGFLERWDRWDTRLFVEIARYGYAGNPAEPPDPGLPGFFPGLPLALRAAHTIIPDWTAAGLSISFVAGAVAMVALARLGDLEGTPGAGTWSAVLLMLSPWAVFLAAGYSEALFLAFALPAWLSARRGRWWAAGLLAAAASAVRVTGLFLAAGLIVRFLLRGEWRRPANAPWLAVPFLSPALYLLYQYARTGDPLAWQHAEEAGWGRELVWPWQSFMTTWHAAFDVHNQFTWSFRAELVAAAVGVALTVWLLVSRRFDEGVYVGGQVLALVTSAFYLSIPRAALLWWPLWLLVGRAASRRWWVGAVYVAASTPLMVVIALTFLRGAWAG